MPLQTKFNSETPRKLKTSSVPRHVQNFGLPALKQSFHSELGTSIFDEGTLPPSLYEGDIISDCWFPDKILPVVPSIELLNALTGPDGQPLYDSSTKQWNTQYLPPVLHKVGSRHRLDPGQEERGLSMFLSAIMDALIRHHDDGRSSTTEVRSQADPSCSSPSKTITSTPAQLSPVSAPAALTSITPIPNPSPPLLANTPTRTSTPVLSTPDVSPSLSPSPLNTATTSATSAPNISIPTSSPLSSALPLQSDHDAPASSSSRRPKHEFPPRLWSSVAATQPLSGDSLLKPDSVLV